MTVATHPDVFTHPRLEYEALVAGVALIDLPRVGVLRLSGADRVRFLNAMVTHDVATLAAGSARESLVTTTKGRIVAELLVLARPDDLVVLVMQGETARVAETLESHIIADDVRLENVTAAFGVLSLEGPKCRDLVWRIFPRQPLPLGPLTFTENEYQGMHATVVRHSVAGGKGLHVVVPRTHLARMREYLVQGGRGMDLCVAGRVAWNMRRIEAGLPWFGAGASGERAERNVDVTEANFPAEARLEDHVSYDKGCYLGQETIARMHHRGHPNWLLVGLSPEGEVPGALRYPEGMDAGAEMPSLSGYEAAARAQVAALSFAGVAVVGAELFAVGGADSAAELAEVSGAVTPDAATADAVATRVAGRITSAAFSPILKCALFLGYVRAGLAGPGARFELRLGGESVSLATVELPLTPTHPGEVSHAQ